MGSNERRERERQKLRKKILDAARALFVTRGYEAVTMREIAKRIEYSATALYSHFADKETLVRELCREDFAEFARKFLDGVYQSQDPRERLCRAGLVYLAFAQQYPQHYRLLFLMDVPVAPPTESERNDPAINAYLFLRELVQEGMRAGILRPDLTDVDLVAQTLWAIVHGAASLDLLVPREAMWLDFKPRAERFAAALEFILIATARDPQSGVQTLRKVIAEYALNRAASGDDSPAQRAPEPPAAKSLPSSKGSPALESAKKVPAARKRPAKRVRTRRSARG